MRLNLQYFAYAESFGTVSVRAIVRRIQLAIGNDAFKMHSLMTCGFMIML